MCVRRRWEKVRSETCLFFVSTTTSKPAAKAVFRLFTQVCVKRGVLLLATHNMTAAHDGLAIEQTLRVYAEACKTMSKWLSEPNPEAHLEGEMIQPVFRVR